MNHRDDGSPILDEDDALRTMGAEEFAWPHIEDDAASPDCADPDVSDDFALCCFGECDNPAEPDSGYCATCKPKAAYRESIGNRCIECDAPCGYGRLCARCYFKVKS